MTPRFGVMGAGSIGCWVGGRLAAAGSGVRFVGREGLGAILAEHGLRATSWDGSDHRIPTVDWATRPEALADREVVLVCVKGLATREVGHALAEVLAPDAIVLSLQNGVTNTAILREALPGRPVFPCMVPFNVVRLDDGRFHQGTSGHLTTATEVPDRVLRAFRDARLPLETHPDMRGVLWGKLLFNLNNAINALADVPLAEQLRDRVWRRVMAANVAEGLAALSAAGIRPVAFLPVPPWVVPHVLRLPTWLFTRVARSMVAVDPDARSSMWEDLQRGRLTEVDLLNGAVVDLGRRHGVPTPLNAAICDAIHAAEAGEPVAERVRALRASV